MKNKNLLFSLALGLTAVNASANLLITQYYEGASLDKYIELTNISASSLDFSLNPFTFANYNNANRENWKTSGSATSTTLLNSGTLGAGSSLIVRNSSAAAPIYAASLGITSGTVNFNGDDSWAIFSGASTTFADLVDVFGVTASGFADTSYTRNSATPTTLDFNASEWTQWSLTDIANAGASDEQRLGFSAIPEPSVTGLLLIGMGFLFRYILKK